MEAKLISNLIEVDTLIDEFLREHKQGISTIHRIYFQNDNKVSLQALIAELIDELRTGCVTFLNKNEDMEGINSYLFYIVNAFCKKKAAPQSKKKTEYLCPGCLFLGKENLITLSKIFKCDDCLEELKHATDPKKVNLFRTFFKHNKLGYKCEDCERFIPHPIDDSVTITCPYFDCCFVGQWASLKRMHHPSSQSNPEKLILDTSKNGFSPMKDSLISDDVDVLSKMEIQEDLLNKIKVIKEVIDFQSNNVPYSSSDSTVKHKLLCYQAFSNLLDQYPAEMVDYLVNKSRSGGFQAKAFQEYISLLEASLPFTFKKDNKMHLVDSLLSDHLSLFEGISVFDEIVTDKLSVKNGTKEFYIGGRKGALSQPFYMGKLLSLIDKKTKQPLMDNVVEYTFSRIKLRDVAPGTEVTVTHLRMPPHYQMGGMVYVNRVRKKISDRVIAILNKENEE
jgi:hypothetical protein